MTTTLQDIIVPELFNPYVINRSMELSALYKSGIVTNNPEFDRLASEPAPIHNMPFFNDLIWLLYNVIFTLYFLKEDVFQHPLV